LFVKKNDAMHNFIITALISMTNISLYDDVAL